MIVSAIAMIGLGLATILCTMFGMVADFDTVYGAAPSKGKVAPKRNAKDPYGNRVKVVTRTPTQTIIQDRLGNRYSIIKRTLTKLDFTNSGGQWVANTASAKSLIGIYKCPTGMRVRFPLLGGERDPYKRNQIKLQMRSGTSTTPVDIVTGTARIEVVDSMGNAKRGGNVIMDDTPLLKHYQADMADVQKHLFLENRDEVVLNQGDQLYVYSNGDVATAMVAAISNIYLDAFMESLQSA